MRLRLPSRLPLSYTFFALVALFVVQQIQQTSIAFSLLFCSFILLGNVAFNVAGGFTRAAGAYVFFFTLLTCTVGVVLKALVGEAADSNLRVPLLDMSAYLCSMAGLLGVVLLVNRLRVGRRSFAFLMGGEEVNYTLSGLGCFAISLVLILLNMTLGAQAGGLVAALNQLNIFPALAILLTTIGAIRDSGGRRSFNLASILAIGLVSVFGTVGFSKQGMLTPFACWVLAVMYTRFRLRLVHGIGLALMVWYSLSIVPLLAAGRNYPTGDDDSFSARAGVVYTILSNLDQARERLRVEADLTHENPTTTVYYDHPQGFIERFTALPVDDAFFAYTAKGNYIGLLPVEQDFENLVPHFLLPDKPSPYNGNYYAHEIGGFLAADDYGTGISFSPVAEAFHVAGWWGVLLLLPGLWVVSLGTIDLICGDLRETPWGLFVVVNFAHSAAESLLSGIIYGIGDGNVTLMIAIYFCTRFTPVVGALFFGRQSVKLGAPAGPGLADRRVPRVS